jgi:3-deoxy-D-manno-octulosonic-acid transferase
MYILYNVILFIAAIFIAPYFLLKIIFAGKYRKSIIQKLGGKQTKKLTSLKDGQKIWIHAVSVGEVTAAAPIVASLKMKKPRIKIIFSTSTETGQEMARRFIKGVDAFIYFPLDIPFVVRKIIESANADIFVLVETELWPNFLRVCKEHRMKTLMVNGRISPRSYKRYLKTAFFWRRILDNLDEAGMISLVDTERIKAIGLSSEKALALGNSKYDGLAAMVSPSLRREISLRLNVREEEKFFIAGSTHEGEEKIVISVYQDILKHYPEFKLIIVPRHIERTNDVVSLLHQANLNDVIKLSDINDGRLRVDERIIIVDVIGELFKVYSLATVVYCGGSLVPKGGQNILEAAAWGKVIFYGPSMEDFSQEKALLEDAGCGITIKSEGELSRGIIQLLTHPEEIIGRGERGREAVLANIGAAARYADLISKHI